MGQSCAIIIKKKKREKSVPQEAWLGSKSPRARPHAKAAAAGVGSVFSSDCALFQVLNTLGLWLPEGLDAVLSGKEAWPAVQLEGDLSHTHRHPQTCAPPLASAPPENSGLPWPPNPQSTLMSRLRQGTWPQDRQGPPTPGPWWGGGQSHSVHPRAGV